MMDSVLKDGFPALQILTQLAEAVVASGEDADLVKSRVCARIAEADKVGPLVTLFGTRWVLAVTRSLTSARRHWHSLALTHMT